MKKIAVVIVAVFGLTLLQPVQAQTNPSIAIIDTGIDVTLPELQGKVIYEVCLMEELQCPNKKAFQEGPGSATLTTAQTSVGTFSHGTRVAQVAVKTNPNINIVFIRIIPAGRDGSPAWVAANANSTVKQALDWVAKNKTKFNIVAVSASVGHKPQLTGTNYCVMRAKQDAGLKQSIATLKTLGVASVFASGNNGNKSRIDYPACLTDAVAISSVSPFGNVENYSNDAVEVDFYALGRFDLSTGSVSGTSAATAAFAAYWAKNYKGNYQLTYDYLKSVAATSTTNKNNTVVDILK
jgi:hypothetical protein